MRKSKKDLAVLLITFECMLSSPVAGQRSELFSRGDFVSYKNNLNSGYSQVKASIVDRYGNIAFDDEMARLDIAVTRLQGDLHSTLFIIVYGGRYGRAKAAQARANRARDYLIDRDVDAARLVAIDGGFRPVQTVELWLVPFGAEPPKLKPTLRPDQVTIRTPRRARRRN